MTVPFFLDILSLSSEYIAKRKEKQMWINYTIEDLDNGFIVKTNESASKHSERTQAFYKTLSEALAHFVTASNRLEQELKKSNERKD